VSVSGLFACSGILYCLWFFVFSVKGTQEKKMKQTFYIELQPDNLVENSEEHHLLLAKYDTDTEKFSFPDKTLTLCGRFNRDKSAPLPVEQLIEPEDQDEAQDEYTEEAYLNYARLTLAEMQNDGTNLCGACVARLYGLRNEQTG
jgi:hypothetical protein